MTLTYRYRTLTKIHHILGHKPSLKLKKIQVRQSRFSDCNGIKLEINNINMPKKKKSPNNLKLSDILPNNSQVNKETKKEIRKYFGLNENKTTY